MERLTVNNIITEPDKQNRESYAAFLKEQIYGTFTLLAVNLGLFLKGDSSVKSALITIATTAIGLWLAGMLASVISYRVVHDKNMPRREFIHEINVHRGLIVAAVPSVVMLTLAALTIIQVQTALIAAITLAIIAMTVAILRSAKTRSNSLSTALISIGIQLAAAALIIFIKLGAK